MKKNLKTIVNSFLRGFGSVLDISGISYKTNIQKYTSKTDAEAIASDWRAVGDDMRKAMGNYKL